MNGNVFNLSNSIEALEMLIKDYLNSCKGSYIDKTSGNQILFCKNDIKNIAETLSMRLKSKRQVDVLDIDQAVDEYLSSRGYAYDYRITNQYAKKHDSNFYYYGVLDFNKYGSARSVNEALKLIASEIKASLKSLNSNSKEVQNDKVAINIVKDSSTKYIKDTNQQVIAQGYYKISTAQVSLTFDIDKMSFICGGNK